MAILASVIANVNRAPDSAPASPDDFLPDWPARDDDEEVGLGND